MDHMKDDVDVLVVGGGTASTIAAIQAGAAAAISVRLETTPRDVPLSDLHDLLVLHGAVVPEKDI
jgi:ribosomal protein S9